MRIVYLSSSGKLGGAERVLLDLLTSLRESEPQWDLRLIAAAPGPLTERASKLGVAVALLPFPVRFAALGDALASGSWRSRLRVLSRLCLAGLDVVRYALALRRDIRAFAPDVVHSNGLKMHVLAAWTSPRDVPVIWHLHDYLGARFASSRLLRWHARRCRAVIAVSLSVAEDARAALGSHVAVHVVPNGVDVEAFSSEGPAADVDTLAGLPPARGGTLKVGLVATFARWKGHDVFLRALAELPGTAPVRGYVVGGPLYDTEGSERSMDELHATVARLGLGDRVGFVGFVDDVAAVMRGLDVVVHASTQPEPFGRVIVEAMAVGRPVIVSFAGGVKEIVDVDHTALIHAPGDWRGLRDSIMRLADDVTLRERLAKAARAAVERRFDRRRPSALLVPIYRTLAPSIPC